MILGDLSIHLNAPTDAETITLTDFLQCYDMVNCVSFPTHKLGNTLDTVISTATDDRIALPWQEDFISDHHVIFFTLAKQQVQPKEAIQYRNTKKIDHGAYCANLVIGWDQIDI